MSESEKFKVGKTFIIGLAFFSSEIAWSLYNAQVPLMLQKYISLFSLIGFMMALDNIIGVILQPIMGAISDKTRTKLGRRMPYLLIGIPSGAIFFALIPTEQNLIQLSIWMIAFSISMGFYRSQAVSLMPDFVQPEHRSKGNAIINLMGGVGNAIGYFLSLLLGLLGLQLIFIIVSIIMVCALLILLWRIKEKESFAYQAVLKMDDEIKEESSKKSKIGLIKSIKDIAKEEDKSTLFILLAIFCWFVGFQGLVALMSIYGTDVLGYEKGLAGFLPFLVVVPLLITIYPLALIPKKIGRRNTIKIGVVMWIILLILLTFLGLVPGIPLYIIAIPLSFLGMGWALINTNSIVIVWELAPSEEKIGTYTGLYYFSSYLAAISGPVIVGFLVDINPLGIASLMLNSAIFFVLAFVMMLFVKRGEVKETKSESN
ncbi:MAG: MFS transporter [Promethearchaeota archaeon]